jgi:uroporphyrinogen-III synthase
MSRLPLVILRPEPGLAETVSLAAGRGLATVAAPLFEIRPVVWHAPAATDFDAIIAGSANAFRHGGGQLAALLSLPVHAVGERTAEAARKAGFAVARVGAERLQDLLDQLPAPARLLRLAGAERLALRPRDGIVIEERVLYRADPVPLAPGAVAAVRAGATVLLHSGAAARCFASECDRLAIDRSRVPLGVLAPRIGTAAGPGWKTVLSSPLPTDGALLALAENMCQ